MIVQAPVLNDYKQHKNYIKTVVYLRTKSIEKQVGEPPDPELQVILSEVLHSSLSSTAIVFNDNIVANHNNKQSGCESKSCIERLSKAFLKLGEKLPATDADVF